MERETERRRKSRPSQDYDQTKTKTNTRPDENQDHTREDEVPQKLRSWPFEVGQKVRGLCESIENRWVYFDGNAPHAVLPFEGQAHHLKKRVLD